MNSIELKERQDISANFKVAKAYKQLKDLLAELKKKKFLTTLSRQLIEMLKS